MQLNKDIALRVCRYLALGLFITSFFLPVIEASYWFDITLNGYQIYAIMFGAFLEWDVQAIDVEYILIKGVLLLIILTNGLFIIQLIFGRRLKKIPRVLLGLIMSSLTLYWLIASIIDGSFDELLIGYWLWMIGINSTIYFDWKRRVKH